MPLLSPIKDCVTYQKKISSSLKVLSQPLYFCFYFNNNTKYAIVLNIFLYI